MAGEGVIHELFDTSSDEESDNNLNNNPPAQLVFPEQQIVINLVDSQDDDGIDLPCKRAKLAAPLGGPRETPCMGLVMNDVGVQPVDFILDNLPSTWSNELLPVSWVYMMLRSRTPSTSKDFVGKWMWFVPASEVDERTIQVASALEQGLLGHYVKVPPVDCVQGYCSTTPSSSSSSSSSSPVVKAPLNRAVPLIVYTADFRDRADVLRVGLALRALGQRGTMSYKPDVFTLSDQGIHGSGQLPRSVYQLRKDQDGLTLTDGGAAYATAIYLATGERDTSSSIPQIPHYFPPSEPER
jgi:hypothetical protein